MNEREEQLEEDLERLMHWAEEEEAEIMEAAQSEGEPCEADIADDRVGLPGGTVGNDKIPADDIADEPDKTQ